MQLYSRLFLGHWTDRVIGVLVSFHWPLFTGRSPLASQSTVCGSFCCPAINFAPFAVTETKSPVELYCPASYLAEDSVGYLMKQVVVSMVQQADKHLEAHGLTNAQWGPLLRLQAVGSCTVVELARWCNVDAGAMTRLLDRLERKALCSRVRCTDDRRVVRVELTAEGEAAIVEVPTVLANVMNMHLAGFSEDEWQTLLDFLKRMRTNGDALRASS